MKRSCTSYFCGYFMKQLNLDDIYNKEDSINNIVNTENIENKVKWVFKYGTVVFASNIANAKILINKILKNTDNYYAFNLVDNIWNIQFTNDIFPLVYVKVESTTGEKAVIKAIESMKKDVISLEIENVII